MTVDFCDDTATTMLTVTCTILSADQPNPFVTMFYIYENVTDNPSPVSTASAFTRATPDFDTEYLCVSGNYLGNTTAARNFVPGTGTTVKPTSNGVTSVPMSSKSPTGGACPCDCPSSGMIAAVSIMVVLLAVSVAVNILQFYKQTKASSQVPSTSEKQARTGLSGGNENSAYEMIESRSKGNAVYQPLTPSTVALEPENLTFFSRLGSIGLGKFGDVWKGELRTKQGVAPVALRQITVSVPDLLQVVKYLQKLPNHQNIVRCLGFCEEYRTIVHEFVSGGTLLTFLKFNNQSSKSPYGNIKPARPRFDESKLLKFAWQVAKGMEFLASNKIIHGNLCAHNILMTEDRICKISDYGMTSFISPSGRKPTRWMSPEGMQNKNWTLESDIWSYGILLWEIVTLGARPYPKMTMDMVKQQVTKGYKMPRPSHCGQELYSIMTSCWEIVPAKRCSYDVIQRKLEPIMEVYHEYLSLQNLDERLYESVADITV
ncbi:tyrosine kinase receptor Cad96Ca-like [Diadema antillarum]|uniref:tyrosine kinase receptor Cad96Ca-like n=1 Tax=Diadema antillarum TaxID=105358 RepID=UPI003A8A6032